MQDPTQVSPQEFVESLKDQTDAYLKSVMEAINLAPDGKWIAGSEEEVRDARLALLTGRIKGSRE